MEKKIDNFVDLLFDFDMRELENETKFLENYKKLQNNWNELKKWLEEYQKTYDKGILVPVSIVKIKMKELEGKNNG